jgi:hypothetical protein
MLSALSEVDARVALVFATVAVVPVTSVVAFVACQEGRLLLL